MKKIPYIFIVLLLIITIPVNATRGALRKASIKKCSDGRYYGYHSSNGTIHWHLAEAHPEMSSGWAAVGDPLSGDPCPNIKHEYTTTTTTTTRPTTTVHVVPVVPATTSTTTTTSTKETTTITESTTTEEITTTSESTTTTTTNPIILLRVNGDSVSIKDNKGEVYIMNWKNDIEFTIENGYSIKVYDGNELINDRFQYESDKEYKVEIYLDDELIETDNIMIKKYSLVLSIFIYAFLFGLILMFPTAMIIVNILLVRNNKKNRIYRR